MGRGRKDSDRAIRVIDLFAGPGGLGEGFASLGIAEGNRCFDLVLSVEKDDNAHRTLELRSFYRQFNYGSAPALYYEYLRGRPGLSREELLDRFPREAETARRRCWLAELGADRATDRELNRRVRAALGEDGGEWVLIGGPPCQAYSLAGRSRMRPVRGERFDEDERHFLYREYLKIIARHRPAVFVMENVKGLLSATAKGVRIFERIREDLAHPELALSRRKRRRPGGLTYELHSVAPGDQLLATSGSQKDFVVEAERFGIPQARHRIFIVGIRSDIASSCDRIDGLAVAGAVSTSDAIGDLPPIRSRLSQEPDGYLEWVSARNSVRDISWDGAGADLAEVRAAISDVLAADQRVASTGGEFVEAQVAPGIDASWTYDPRLGGVCNHAARSHRRDDIHRYLFCSAFAQVRGRSPQLNDFPAELLPAHGNVARAIESEGLFSDRFRVQLRDAPSSTVTCHISKDGHYFIHYDPLQCRSLTVREAARLQTFPDNYFFEGARTYQYHQVGNAVPPLLAKQIAEVVYALLRP